MDIARLNGFEIAAKFAETARAYVDSGRGSMDVDAMQAAICAMGTEREPAMLRRACHLVIRRPDSSISSAVLARAIAVVRHRRFMRASAAFDDVTSRRFDMAYRVMSEEDRNELDRSAIAMHTLYEMDADEAAKGQAIEEAITNGSADPLLALCERVGTVRKVVSR